MRRLRHGFLLALIAVTGVLVIAGSANALPPPKTALINGATVSGSPSQEENFATTAGFTVTVVSDAAWAAMTAAQFGAYDLLIAGDPTCGFLAPGLLSSAATYGSVVMGTAGGRTVAGNRVLVGTDPVFHDSGGGGGDTFLRHTIIEEGIAFAGAQAQATNSTGMYFDASCAGITVPVLDALSAPVSVGLWTINPSPPCGGSVSLIASNPSFAGLTTATLQGWGCSVHESFPTFRDDWSALAVATDTPTTPTCGIDPADGLSHCGQAYILIAGSGIVVASQGISLTPLDATNPAGPASSHTVIANVHETGGTPPVVGALVTFTVTGVNPGAPGICVPADCKSNSSGDVSFTYLDGNGAGDDTIKASFTDAGGFLQTATAQKHWVMAATGTITVHKTVDAGGESPASFCFTLAPDPGNGEVCADGTTGDAVFLDVPAAMYDVLETASPATYHQVSSDCTALVLAGGGSVSCDVHDAINTGTITVHKTVDAGGASPTSFCFTLSPDPGNGQVCADAAGDAVFGNVPAGTYGATETASLATYHEVSNTCTGLVIAAQGDSLTCDVHNTFTPIPHDVDSHLKTGGDIRLGNVGSKVTSIKADCKNEDPAEMVRCTLQVTGLPAGCTATSTGVPVSLGFLLDDTSFYGLNQTKHFDFNLKVKCVPNLAAGVVAILTFTICADGGFIDLANPCVDSDLIVDRSPNVVVRTNKLKR